MVLALALDGYRDLNNYSALLQDKVVRFRYRDVGCHADIPPGSWLDRWP